MQRTTLKRTACALACILGVTVCAFATLVFMSSSIEPVAYASLANSARIINDAKLDVHDTVLSQAELDAIEAEKEAAKRDAEEEAARIAAEEAAAAEAAAAAEVQYGDDSDYYYVDYDGFYYEDGYYYDDGGGWYNTDGLTASSGVNYYNGRKETYYSSNVLYHHRTGEWTAGDDGVYRDADGYVVIAANENEYSEGDIIDTSFGQAKVYDSGCDYGITDVYVNW